MIHHLRGRLVEKTPTYAVVECGGVGYQVHISLTTFEQIGSDENIMIHTHLVVREDAQLLYGFAQPEERQLFLALIGVSGVGANTARMILSAMNADTACQAIQQGDVDAMKRVKGIGAKTAQRIIIDLQDKLGAISVAGSNAVSGASGANNKVRQDALIALTTLGFDRARCEKTLDQILGESTESNPVETLIKIALKRL
ncbi:MAG: Holliday junction branch migration protein RuvA [Flavobacteriales bacterium]|nr:Holliday junction branch migration protein RuvA [Flavobacteriales bacterium]